MGFYSDSYADKSEQEVSATIENLSDVIADLRTFGNDNAADIKVETTRIYNKTRNGSITTDSHIERDTVKIASIESRLGFSFLQVIRNAKDLVLVQEASKYLIQFVENLREKSFSIIEKKVLKEVGCYDSDIYLDTDFKTEEMACLSSRDFDAELDKIEEQIHQLLKSRKSIS